MNKALPIAATIIIIAAFTGEASPSIGLGATYRGGMKLKVKGGGSHAAGTSYSTSKSVGEESNGSDGQSSKLSFGYTGGERTFGEGTTTLGSGTVHADGTYVGGDYSAVYDDVYFSDNRTTVETVGGKTTTKSSANVTGETAWGKADDFDGWGVRLDAEFPLLGGGEDGGATLSAFIGLRGFWGIDGECSGKGPAVNYRTTTSTSGAQTKTTDSFYDLTAPLDLNGKLDFDNAEVFEGSTVKYTPVKGTSSSRSSSALSLAKLEAEADIYQAAIGASIGFGCGRLTVSARPSLLLNDIDVEATRTEVLATSAGKIVNSWRDTSSKNKFAIGAGAELSVECAISESLGISVTGGYEWIDKVEFGVGPQKVELDPSAWTVSAGIRYSF